MSKSARALAIMLGLFCFALAFGIGCNRPDKEPAEPTGVTVDPSPDDPIGDAGPALPLSPLTGLPYEATGGIVAVSIDNHPAARPQCNLARADVVYEAVTEGGITRYLALFHSQDPEVVGPVRSARPYFALLAKEWDAVFAHCGGDPKDIAPIREWEVLDADEFRYQHLYWRDSRREPPHNLYTSVENLRKVADDPSPEPAKRYEFQDWTSEPVFGIEMRYAPDYSVRYEYADGKYERWILQRGEEPWRYKDLDSGEVPQVSNVIVQFAKTEVVYADGGVVIDLLGIGRAVFVLGGRYMEGTWTKQSVDSPTLFLGPDGEAITLTPGQTWVQIVSERADVSLLTDE